MAMAKHGGNDHDPSWAGLQSLLALLLLPRPRSSTLTTGASANSSSTSTSSSTVTLPEQIAEWTSRAFRAILTLSSRIDGGDGDVINGSGRADRGTTTTTTTTSSAASMTNATAAVSNVHAQQQASVAVSHPRSYREEEKDDSYDDAYDDDSEGPVEQPPHGSVNGNQPRPASQGVFTTLQWRLFQSLWSLRPPLLLNEPMPVPVPQVNPSSSSGSGRSSSDTTMSTSYAVSDEGDMGKHVFALLLAVVEGPPPRTTPSSTGAGAAAVGTKATLGGQGLGQGQGQRQGLGGLDLEWGYRRKLCDNLFRELRRAAASSHTLAESVRPAAVAGTLSLLRCLLLPSDPSSSFSSSSDIDAVMMMTGKESTTANPSATTSTATTTTTTTATATTTHHANGFSKETEASTSIIHAPSSSSSSSSSSHGHDHDHDHSQFMDQSNELLQHFVVDKGLLTHLMVDCLGFVPQDTYLASLTATQQPPQQPLQQPDSYAHHSQDKPTHLDNGYSSLPLAGLHPLCSDEPSKRAAFALLLSLCHRRPTLIDEVFRMLLPVVSSLPALSAWDYKPSRETRSTTGFVGLKNKGCTCYMNSLLQVSAALITSLSNCPQFAYQCLSS